MSVLDRSTWILCVGLCLVTMDTVQANWWMYLNMAAVGINPQQPQTKQTDDKCDVVPDLVIDQIRLCQKSPEAMPCVGLGANLGFYECQYQFAYERWNCTTPLGSLEQATALKKGTREKAFVYAVTSAGVVHAVTKSCSAGNLTDCACDMSQQGRKTKEGWHWGGCSDNIDYGIWFAKTFIDAPDKMKSGNSKNLRAKMNLHNNEVGRRAVQQSMTVKCRCHGVSGSCAVKSCWNTIPSFRKIGDILKKKYSKSIELQPKKTNRMLRRGSAGNVRMRRKVKNVLELVYVDESPNYCKRNLKRGITGTKGRECKRDSRGPESCDSLCCGRGYNTKVVRLIDRCHCKFIWCCEVKCKVCETIEEKYYCK